ncbi:MAG: hypothetical protein U5J83_16100 [Bryobacterales bacterium]|nr:hypothetical protein [Bryobacterales bacterium]
MNGSFAYSMPFPRRQSVLFRMALWLPLSGIMLLVSCAPESPRQEPVAKAPPAPRIVSFYPGQPAVAPGDKAQVCYGVENADTVRLEPDVEQIRPLTTKCFWFEPERSMKLTLIATGTGGEEARETIDITVRAGAPSTTTAAPPAAEGALIDTFIATSTSIRPGGGSTVCYVLREPATVTLQPASGPLDADLKKCILVRPKATTRYTLTAKAGNKSDSASVTIRVE